METKLLRRVIDNEGKLFYPIKKGSLVPFNQQLIEQALFGAKVQKDLIASTVGLKDLITDLTAQAKEDGFVTMFGGRRVSVRHAHATLNSQLQGMGAEAMKHYLTFYHETAKNQGLIHGYHFKQQACIYDEVDLIAKDIHKYEIAEILKSTYKQVSDHLGMKCEYTGEVMLGPNWYSCH
jgi:DNA polymerase-1